MTDYQKVHDESLERLDAVEEHHRIRGEAIQELFDGIRERLETLEDAGGGMSVKFFMEHVVALRKKLEASEDRIDNLEEFYKEEWQKCKEHGERLDALEEHSQDLRRSAVGGWIESMKKDGELLGHTCELGKRVKVLEGEDNQRIDHIEEALHIFAVRPPHAIHYIQDHIPRPDLSEENE